MKSQKCDITDNYGCQELQKCCSNVVLVFVKLGKSPFVGAEAIRIHSLKEFGNQAIFYNFAGIEISWKRLNILRNFVRSVITVP